MPKVRPEKLDVETSPGAASRALGDLGPFEARSLSGAFGLTHLGASLETLPPGSTSSHRHWHERADEVVVLLSGTLTLVQDAGSVPMQSGDIALFAAGNPDGHCLKNESKEEATFLVVASRDPSDRCHYVEAGAVLEPDGTLRRADGSMILPASEGQ